MEAALLLLFFVIVEMALTVWLLARHAQYMRRIGRLESMVDAEKRRHIEVPSQEDDSKADVSDLIANATPEDMEQARQVLAALGLGGEDGKR